LSVFVAVLVSIGISTQYWVNGHIDDNNGSRDLFYETPCRP
jgi:hypothetical protein